MSKSSKATIFSVWKKPSGSESCGQGGNIMRRFLIDTDTGTDDAVAIIMALKEQNVMVEGITTVCGNVGVQQATRNCLKAVEMAGTYCPPVYSGLSMPILRETTHSTTQGPHGIDGMGDLALSAPLLQPQKEHGVDFLIRYIDENPGQLELVTLGPVTNLAWVALKSPETLSKLKCIYMMMGTGAWFGNASPMAEGNAYMDPEALDIVFRLAKTKIILIGWDMCIHEYLFTQQEIQEMYQRGTELTKFCLDITHTLVSLNRRRFGAEAIDFADPVAMAVALQPELVEEMLVAYAKVSTSKDVAYGAIAADLYGRRGKAPNVHICRKLNARALKACVFHHIC